MTTFRSLVSVVLCAVMLVMSVPRNAHAQVGPAEEVAAQLDAADHGDVDAQLRLGTRYLLGDGVKRDDAQAAAWWCKAAATWCPTRQRRRPATEATAALALQFSLPSRSTFEIAYVGNRGGNLQFTYAANQTPFGIDGSVAANRPFPQWAQITMGATRGQSSSAPSSSCPNAM